MCVTKGCGSVILTIRQGIDMKGRELIPRGKLQPQNDITKLSFTRFTRSPQISRGISDAQDTKVSKRLLECMK